MADREPRAHGLLALGAMERAACAGLVAAVLWAGVLWALVA